MDYVYDLWLSNLNAVVHNGGFIQILPDTKWHVDWHRFKQNKFYYVTKGEFTISIENREYIAKAGDWFFIPANTLHCYENNLDTGFEKYWMHFDLYPVEADLFKLLNLPYVIHTSNDKKTLELFSKYANANASTIADRLEVKACLLQLLSRYITLSDLEKIEIKSDNDERIDEILKYINENLDKELTNYMLSRMCYLHSNHFIRFFKAKTNQTPASYIRQRRLETAKRLLENSDLGITEIARRVGIEDVSFFSKQFKMYFSMSPREYRKYYRFHLQSAEKQITGE